MAGTGPAVGSEEVRLKDVKATEQAVEVVGRVVSLARREYVAPGDSRRRPYLTGFLTDGTATLRFTWWEPPHEGIERGTVLRAVNAQVREWRGRPELSFGFRTRVGPASPAELPQVDGDEIPFRTVRDLLQSDEGFRLEARVVRVAARAVMVGTDQRVVHDGVLADASGSIAFSSWSDFRLKGGEAIRIAGAYVRRFRGRAQLQLDEHSIVTRIEGQGLPTPEAVLNAAPTSIADVEAAGGSASVTLEGRILGLLPPSGLLYRCPTCRRTLARGVCSSHGAVEGVPDLRARLVVDDGSGAATINAGRAETERLSGVTLETALARLREAPDPALLEEQLFASVFGRRVRVRGAASVDEFGVTITPEEIAPADPSVEALAGSVARRLRA